MLDNSMTAPRPGTRDAGECENCGANHAVPAGTHPEDVSFRRTACAAPGCITDLCGDCIKNGYAFVCLGCNKRFCEEAQACHRRRVVL
jgi:hypothetical protein